MTARRRIVVVGAGSAGCVLAERLTRDPRIEVTLLEAGPAGAGDDDLELSTLPVGPRSERVVHHRTPDGLDLARGHGLGGSSAVNGGYFMRWHDADFAGWDRRWWDGRTVADGYTDLDGGEGGGGSMSVRRPDTEELHPYARAFESHWQTDGYTQNTSVVPEVGVNRVRINAQGSLRMSADRAHLDRARGRDTLIVRTGCEVSRLVIDAGRVRGVRLTGTGEVVAADETILCAGTLASAALVDRSTGAGIVRPVVEHRELLVRYAPGADAQTVSAGRWPLLQTVLHTADGIEIRCYNDDFAHYIDGVPPSGPAIGIATMHPRSAGRLTLDAAGDQSVDLGAVGEADAALLRFHAHRVVDMLEGLEFRGLVRSGSATVDSTTGTSQHAWGSMPMGSVTDWTGAVVGLPGLRVADGSILPTSGSSGPHETIMMVAGRIADIVLGQH